jgi:hypothetical protein
MHPTLPVRGRVFLQSAEETLDGAISHARAALLLA